MTLKEMIEKLQELNEEDYIINQFEVKPYVNRTENWEGKGIETVEYFYYITIKGKPIKRNYINKCGIIEYKEIK